MKQFQDTEKQQQTEVTGNTTIKRSYTMSVVGTTSDGLKGAIFRFAVAKKESNAGRSTSGNGESKTSDVEVWSNDGKTKICTIKMNLSSWLKDE